jgi:NitT/TauT family transport system permease protein
MDHSSGEALHVGLETAAPTVKKRTFAPRVTLAVQTYAWRLVIALAILTSWETAVRLKWVNSFLLGSPSGIWEAFLRMLLSGQLLNDIGATLTATLVGFAAGSLLGSLLGLGLWYSPLLARVIDPLVIALNGVPKIALAPMIIIWFGSGMFSKMALASIATFVVALLSAYQGATQVDRSLVNLMRSFGAKKYQVFWKVVVPSSIPWVISAFRLNIGFALVAVVGGEFISSDRGLGHMIFVAGNLFNLNTVWVGVILLMIAAMLLYTVVGYLESKLLSWSKSDAGPRTSVGA